MRVTILGFNPEIASTRYRAMAPARYLRENGVTLCDDGDLLLIGKHDWPEDLLSGFKAYIYDVCDDHFADELADFYRKRIGEAALVTCNSDAMRFRIFQETGRVATVIPDAYERSEEAPSWGEGLLWFGHHTNLKDLFRCMKTLKGLSCPMGVISSHEPWMSDDLKMLIIPWSPTAMDKGLKSCAAVILPTGRSPCKSANRMIEAVRAGKFVIAEPLPAYEEFADWMWVGDIREGVEWALKHEKDCLRRVSECQRYVAKHYGMARIGPKWLSAVKKAYPWSRVLGGS